MFFDFFFGARQLAVSAAFGRQIDDDRARCHAGNHFLGYENGRFFSWNDRRRDDHIAFRHHFSKKFALLFVELFSLGGGIAARVLSVFGFDGDFDEASAEALNLLLYSGAQVVSGNNCAKSSRSSDSLESGDTAADDKNARGSDRSCGGGEHGENLGKRVGGDHNSFVAADGGHR